MIDYISIQSTLNKLDSEYNASTDLQMPILYSKLAVLELCGWIETNINGMLFEYIDTHVIDPVCITKIKKIIDKNYGFHYERNLFPLLCSVLGINNLENVIDKISLVDFQNLQSITEVYTLERNKAAHTDTPLGTTRSYKAPSSVLYDYALIKPAIQTIENEIKRL